jgi:hypothetical protein
MRRTLTLCRSGLTAAAALVLLTACGGDSGGGGSASSAPAETSSSAPEEADAPAADSEFCTQAQALVTTLESAFSDQSDPTSLTQQFQQTADAMRGIEAPDEIAGDWTTLADGLEQYAQAFAELDINDPASASEFQQRTAPLEADLTTAGTNVENYLTTECGIETEPTEGATPTS